MEPKKSVFWRTYRIILIISVLLLVAALVFLAFKLKDYEDKQPDNIAAEVFATYFENADANKIAGLVFNKETTQEEKVALINNISDLLESGDTAFRNVSSSTDINSQKYMVTVGNKNLISFTLNKVSGSDSQLLFGILTLKYADYELGEFVNEIGTAEYNFDGVDNVVTNIYSVVASYDYIVFADGELLTNANVVELNVQRSDIPYTPEGLVSPTNTRYSFKSDKEKPVVKVTTPQGDEVKVNYDETTKTYTADYNYSYYLYNTYNQRIIEASEVYARYLQNDASFGNVAPYLDMNSKLYEQTRTTQTGFVIDHDGYEFADENTYMYIQWSNTVFSCRVKLKHILHKAGAEDYVEYLDKIFFIRVEGENLYIFDSYNMN